HAHAGVFDDVGGAGGGNYFETHVHKFAGDIGDVRLVVVGDADEDHALRRQLLSGGELGFGEGFAEVVGHAHDFSGGLHLRAEDRVHAGEFVPGEDRGLHVEVVTGVEVFLLRDEVGEKFAELASGHQARGDFCHRDAGGFRHIRHRSRSSGIYFDHVNYAVVSHN